MPRWISCPWFVGRSEELGELVAALDTLVSYGSATVLIGGDAGIGKSRLVTELASRARATDVEVLIGGCLDLAEGWCAVRTGPRGVAAGRPPRRHR